MAITTAKSAGPTGDFRGDLEVSNKLPSASDMDNVAHLPVLDAAGASHAFTTLHAHADQRVLIIFIRHFFCGVRCPPPFSWSAARPSHGC